MCLFWFFDFDFCLRVWGFIFIVSVVVMIYLCIWFFFLEWEWEGGSFVGIFVVGGFVWYWDWLFLLGGIYYWGCIVLCVRNLRVMSVGFVWGVVYCCYFGVGRNFLGCSFGFFFLYCFLYCGVVLVVGRSVWWVWWVK